MVCTQEAVPSSELTMIRLELSSDLLLVICYYYYYFACRVLVCFVSQSQIFW